MQREKVQLYNTERERECTEFPLSPTFFKLPKIPRRPLCKREGEQDNFTAFRASTDLQHGLSQYLVKESLEGRVRILAEVPGRDVSQAVHKKQHKAPHAA